MTPTQRSLALLREQSYLCAIVEKWVPFPKPGHRSDLFGIGDILAVKPGFPPLLIQTTSTGVSARVKKIVAADSSLTLIAAGWQIVVHGWSRRGARGKRKVYTCRMEPITAESFKCAPST